MKSYRISGFLTGCLFCYSFWRRTPSEIKSILDAPPPFVIIAMVMVGGSGAWIFGKIKHKIYARSQHSTHEKIIKRLTNIGMWVSVGIAACLGSWTATLLFS